MPNVMVALPTIGLATINVGRKFEGGALPPFYGGGSGSPI